MQSIMQLFAWFTAHQTEILEGVGAVYLALTAVIHALGMLAGAFAALAKLTPGDADDNAVAKFAGLIKSAQGGLDWMHHLIFRTGMQKRGAVQMIADGVGSLPPEDPAERKTKPELPSAKQPSAKR